MKDLELANKLANVYCTQWWTDETKLDQLRILRSTVLAPLLGPIIDGLESEVTMYMNDGEMSVIQIGALAEKLRDFVVGERNAT